MIIHKDSHLDHGLTEDQKTYILDRFKDHNEFFILSFVLPEELGTLPCGLHGPVMGDAPVNGDARMMRRGTRPYESRVVDRPARPTRTVTVIAGPHKDEAGTAYPCVLYTAFGGPLTPKEPGDPTLGETQRAESEAFWKDHALSVQL